MFKFLRDVAAIVVGVAIAYVAAQFILEMIITAMVNSGAL